MRYREKIIQYFDSVPPGSVIAANELYEKYFSKMSEAAFFKAVERLAGEQILVRVAKGMYTRPSCAQDGARKEAKQTGEEAADELAVALETVSGTEADEAVLNFFFGENNAHGMYIGSRLYFKYGISNVLSDEIRLYSSRITKECQNIGRVHVKRVHVALNFENTRVIEALEILQHYDQIENLNKARFARYAKQFALGYNDAAAVYVLKQMKYKKSTIAFMKKILDIYKIENTLQQFLSYASRYKVPPVQRLAR